MKSHNFIKMRLQFRCFLVSEILNSTYFVNTWERLLLLIEFTVGFTGTWDWLEENLKEANDSNSCDEPLLVRLS